MNCTYVSAHVASAAEQPEANLARSRLFFMSYVLFIPAAWMLVMSMLIQTRPCWVFVAAFVTVECGTGYFSAVLRMSVVFVQSQTEFSGKSFFTYVTLNLLR